jgi:hypothetical protein
MALGLPNTGLYVLHIRCLAHYYTVFKPGKTKQTNSVDFSPQANYTDRSTDEAGEAFAYFCE